MLKTKEEYSKRKQCSECPWKVRNNHNNKWIKFVKDKKKKHNCHMLTRDVWDVDQNKVCVGIKIK